MIAPALAERLAALDTATMHESGAKAILSPEIRMLSGNGCVVGPARTVMCHPGDNLMIHVGVAEAEKGDVLVVQCHDPGYGVWGEVLSVAAMARAAGARLAVWVGADPRTPPVVEGGPGVPAQLPPLACSATAQPPARHDNACIFCRCRTGTERCARPRLK